MSRRAQGLVAAGVLAFSYASPTAVLAQEGDQDQALTADPATSSAPGADVDSAPGDSDEADDSTASADDEIADGTGPVGPDLVTEGDPADATEAPTPTPTGIAATPASAPPASAPAIPPPAVAPPATAPAATAPGTDPSSAPAPGENAPAAGGTEVTAPSANPNAVVVPGISATGPAGASRGGNAREPGRARARRRVLHLRSGAAVRVVHAAPAPVAQPAVAPGQTHTTAVAYVAQQAPVPAVARHAGRPARPGDRVHVVFAGESLWSVAQDVLGGRATNAQIAREVERLWSLNRERIGTGDRDLLPIGTRLVLR